MQSDGSLRRLRTREKRFRPVAAAVNAAHHHLDSATYPFSWTWKDASTKVQNMRHQYLLVKQKLISSSGDADNGGSGSSIDWSDGLSLWPNFLRYKSVFGDAPLPEKISSSSAKPSTSDAHPLPASVEDSDLGLGLGFDCGGFDYEETSLNLPMEEMEVSKSSVKRKKGDKRGWAKLVSQLERICNRELQMDDREREMIQKEEAVEKRRLAAAEEEREWEERMELRRTEWRRRMEEMLARHRIEMEQLTARVIHEQQAVVGQLVSLVGQWAGQGIGGSLGDSGGIGNHHPNQAYHLSQMMQGLHHVNAMVPGENRIDGDSQEDEFIVDD